MLLCVELAKVPSSFYAELDLFGNNTCVFVTLERLLILR
jgi:hypothetical protein